MSLLPDICTAVATEVVTGELGLVVGPHAERLQMLELSAVLALRGKVRVLDGGNSYNALYVARYLRRHTVALDETLDRIVVARAFTCYQVVSLLEETAVSAAPTLVLDLLSTFYDESVTTQEAHRLLRLVMGHVQRLRQKAPVIVSLRPSPVQQPDRAGLMKLLQDAADHLLIRDVPAEPRPVRLL